MKKLLAKIDEVVERINVHPEYSSSLRTREFNTLLAEAAKHSLSLELEEENLKKSALRKRERVALQNLDSASSHLDMYGLSLGTLAALGYLIEPDKNKTRNFRITEVQFGSFNPPHDYDQIAGRMKSLVELMEHSQAHPVLKAIEAHLEIVQVHPFVDGNGRSARLVQGYCLKKSGYTPGIIVPSDREHYIALLNIALKDRYAKTSSFEKPSDGENLFRTFVATKVLGSARRLEEDLRAQRKYVVTLVDVPDRAIVISTAQRIRSYGHHIGGQGVKVRILDIECSGRKDKVLDVTGDIGYKQVNGIVTKCALDYGFKTSVHSKSE
ncbi:Fic family protein [Candidatus Woesearchaeota archaeon]|nr:Fic family protein [Candidatus Woesearchaeota archaeon]